MKKHLTTLAAIAAGMGALATQSSAQVLYEGFDYAAGTNTASETPATTTTYTGTATNGVGLTGNWVMNRGGVANVNGSSFDASSFTFDALATTGGKLLWDGVNTTGAASNFLQAELTSAAKTSLAPGAAAKTVWMSALIKPNGAFANGSGAYLGNNAGSGDTVGATVAGLGFNSSGNAVVYYNNGLTAASAGTYASSGTYWLVGNFTYSVSGGTTTFTAANLWIYDASTDSLPANEGALGTAAASFAGSSTSGGSRAPFYLRVQAGGSGNDPQFDEIRAGLSFADVAQSTSDTTAPAWESGFPTVGAETADGFTLSVKTNETGTVYYVVLPDGASAPTSAQVMAGQNASSVPVSPSGSTAVSSGVSADIPLAGLIPSTSYDVYLVAKDTIGNLQATPVLVNATTASDLVVYDGFSYTAGANTASETPASSATYPGLAVSGSGLTGNWVMNRGGVTNVNGSSFDASGFTFDALSTSGGKLLWDGVNSSGAASNFLQAELTAGAKATLAPGASNKTVWMSGLIKPNGAFANGLGVYLSNNAGSGDTTGATVAGLGFNATGNAVVYYNNGSTAASAGTYGSGGTYWLVGNFTYNVSGGTTTFSAANLWIYDASTDSLPSNEGALGSAAASFAGSSTSTGNRAPFYLRLQTGSSGNDPQFDEIRVGNTYAAVAPSGAPPANNYTTWASDNNVTGGVNGDSDNDGITNGMEYALQTNLTGSDGSPGSYTGGTLSFTKRQDAIDNEDVTYVIETSPDLSPPWIPQVTHNPGNTTNPITYALPTGQGKIFARLRVEIAP